MALTEDDLKELEDNFHALDKDADGVLTKNEAGLIWRSIGANPKESEINEMFKAMDTDDSGVIDCKEFMTWMAENGRKEEHMEDSMLEAFRVFDKDGNGFVTREELRRIMSELGEEPLSREEIDALMSNVDVDGDGRINYEEFIHIAFSAQDLEDIHDHEDHDDEEHVDDEGY